MVRLPICLRVPLLGFLSFMYVFAAVENHTVYRQPGRYGGWPANHHIWSWGNEVVVGFEAGYFKFSETNHAIDFDKPAEHLLARSLDGGVTWTTEKPHVPWPRLRWRRRRIPRRRLPARARGREGHYAFEWME